MKLNDSLPDSFEYEGTTYPIDLSFDNVLDVFEITARKDIVDIEKIHLALALLIGDRELDSTTAVALYKHIESEFLAKAQRKAVQYDVLGNEMPMYAGDEDEGKHFSMAQDADLIYASFLAEYNIDLIEEQGRLHWYKFQALLQGLSSECILQRVIQIRLWKPKKGDSAEYKKGMRKIQDNYRLKDED